MPVHHDVAQYSEAYDRLKLGIPTSSNFHKIITPQGKLSKQWREYACVLIAERLLQQRIEFYNSPAMERGLIVESEAADWYEFDRDVITQRVGFITDDDHSMGCSPDRLVGEDGLLEIKAPLPHTQVEYWISGRSMNAFGPNCRVSSTSHSAAGSISCAGMTCCPSLSCGWSPMTRSSKRSTTNCGSSVTLSRAWWKRSAPCINCRCRPEEWRCGRRCAQASRCPHDLPRLPSAARISQFLGQSQP